MKKTIVMTIAIISIFIAIMASNNIVQASTETEEDTKSEIVELKNEQVKTLEQYEEKYGSKSYGLTAYILHLVQVFSIPLCFLGIVIGGVRQYILGLRHLESAEKGLGLMVTFVTLAVICQVLPLVFAVVAKFGRE